MQSHSSEIMGTEILFIIADEKSTGYSSAKKVRQKCDNSKMHEELIQDTIAQNYRQIVHFETNLGTKIHQSKLF